MSIFDESIGDVVNKSNYERALSFLEKIILDETDASVKKEAIKSYESLVKHEEELFNKRQEERHKNQLDRDKLRDDYNIKMEQINLEDRKGKSKHDIEMTKLSNC